MKKFFFITLIIFLQSCSFLKINSKPSECLSDKKILLPSIPDLDPPEVQSCLKVYDSLTCIPSDSEFRFINYKTLIKNHLKMSLWIDEVSKDERFEVR